MVSKGHFVARNCVCRPETCQSPSQSPVYPPALPYQIAIIDRFNMLRTGVGIKHISPLITLIAVVISSTENLRIKFPHGPNEDIIEIFAFPFAVTWQSAEVLLITLRFFITEPKLDMGVKLPTIFTNTNLLE